MITGIPTSVSLPAQAFWGHRRSMLTSQQPREAFAVMHAAACASLSGMEPVGGEDINLIDPPNPRQGFAVRGTMEGRHRQRWMAVRDPNQQSGAAAAAVVSTRLTRFCSGWYSGQFRGCDRGGHPHSLPPCFTLLILVDPTPQVLLQKHPDASAEEAAMFRGSSTWSLFWSLNVVPWRSRTLHAAAGTLHRGRGARGASHTGRGRGHAARWWNDVSYNCLPSVAHPPDRWPQGGNRTTCQPSLTHLGGVSQAQCCVCDTMFPVQDGSRLHTEHSSEVATVLKRAPGSFG